MSKSANRSFIRINRDDLRRLAKLSVEYFKELFRNRPYSRAYDGRLRLICLVQGAAKYYVSPERRIKPKQRYGGVHDFDMCGFFKNLPSRPFPSRGVRGRKDFGASKFGRDKDRRYMGRRVDILGRSITIATSEVPIGSVQRYLRDARTKSAKIWAKRPVVVVWPDKYRGRVIWPY